jgi:hypothetical protein
MANTSRINGFRPVKQNVGAPYNGQSNLYYVASAADEILVGDVVKLSGSGDAIGNPGADLCGASDVPVGVVVGIMQSKFDPMGKMTTGSVSLDLPAMAQIAVSGAGYLLVADSPDLLLEVEVANGSFAVTDIGLNASHANGARTAATVTSPAYIDAGTEATTNTLNFNLRGFSQKVDNEVGASAKLIVGFNVHQFKSGTGSTGI